MKAISYEGFSKLVMTFYKDKAYVDKKDHLMLLK